MTTFWTDGLEVDVRLPGLFILPIWHSNIFICGDAWWKMLVPRKFRIMTQIYRIEAAATNIKNLPRQLVIIIIILFTL
jgi:hypothetical protein